MGQSEFAEHYNQALMLTRDNSIQKKRLKLLQRQCAIWMKGNMEPLVTMRRSAPNTETALRLAEPTVRKRKIIMDSMRKKVASMEKAELVLLQERGARESQLQALTKLTLLVNGTFALVLAAGLATLPATGARKLEAANLLLNDQMRQRERAEREAELFNNHNEMILQAASEGITGVNRSGKTTFFNPAAEEITGYSAAEAIGKTQHDLLHFKRSDGSPYPIQDCPIMATRYWAFMR